MVKIGLLLILASGHTACNIQSECFILAFCNYATLIFVYDIKSEFCHSGDSNGHVYGFNKWPSNNLELQLLWPFYGLKKDCNAASKVSWSNLYKNL